MLCLKVSTWHPEGTVMFYIVVKLHSRVELRVVWKGGCVCCERVCGHSEGQGQSCANRPAKSVVVVN